MLFFIVIDNIPCKIYDSQTFPMLKKKKILGNCNYCNTWANAIFRTFPLSQPEG